MYSVGVHYTGKPLDKAAFAGVRVLFSDLFLLTGVTTPINQFAAMEAMLRNNVDPTVGGPYLLIVWTSHDEEVDPLRTYLRERLESPVLLVDEAVGPLRLLVNARFQISMVTPPAAFTPLFRIREQLLATIVAHAAEYQTRPGVVKLPE